MLADTVSVSALWTGHGDEMDGRFSRIPLPRDSLFVGDTIFVHIRSNGQICLAKHNSSVLPGPPDRP